MIRRLVLLGEVVLTLGLCGSAWAAQSLYPYPCATPCTPNTCGFGYFPTRWRQWPGEQRLEQTNPKAFGAEVLPTPEGQEQVAPPAAAVPGQPPAAAPGGEILPPGGAILPPQQPGAPPKSFRPSRKPRSRPSRPAEGGLPGCRPSRPRAASGSARERATEAGDQTQGTTQAEGHDKVRATGEVPGGDGAGRHRTSRRWRVGRRTERQVQPGTVVSLVDPQDPERGRGRRPHTAPTRLPLRRPRRRPTRSRRRPTPRSSRPHPRRPATPSRLRRPSR